MKSNEMWYGFNVEQKCKCVGKIFQDQKRHGRLGQMWKSCWHYFLILTPLCTMNSYLRDKLWITGSIWNNRNIWEKISEKKDLCYGETTPYSSITTMNQLMYPYLFVTFGQNWNNCASSATLLTSNGLSSHFIQCEHENKN